MRQDYLVDNDTIRLPLWRCAVDRPGGGIVTECSSLTQRCMVERFAFYFRREMHYDSVQFRIRESEGALHDKQWVAFLFVSRNDILPHGVGATCFRWRHWGHAPASWAMQWAWLHPYYRNQHYLTDKWPIFCSLFGDFVVEDPLSPAMQVFYNKHKGKPEHCEADTLEACFHQLRRHPRFQHAVAKTSNSEALKLHS
jgi:hypothetical protein